MFQEFPMIPSTIRSAAALAIFGALSTVSSAQLNTISLHANGPSFTLDNIIGGRTSSSAGLCQLTTGTPEVNHGYQNWFWLRVGNDSREYALSNQVDNLEGSDYAAVSYQEPASDGALPNAVRVDLQYTLANSRPDFGHVGEGMLVINWSVRNLTAAPLSVNLLHYADFDAGGSTGGDSAIVEPNSGLLQQITDPGSALAPATRIDYVASGNHNVTYQIATYPVLINSLNDSTPTSLLSVGAPFGPGDYTGAQQWQANLDPHGGAGDTMSGSVTIHVITECKADFNRSGTVSIQDIFDFLSAWFTGCP
jgi:hypothetical protein